MGPQTRTERDFCAQPVSLNNIAAQGA